MSTRMITTVVVMTTMVMVPVVVGVMPIVGTIAPVAPVGIPTPVGTVRIAPVGVPSPVVAAPVGTIAPTHVEARVVVPIERVVTVHINVGVAATRVIVVIIADGRGSTRAETLDAGCIVGIVVSLGGGVNHAVGVGHRFSGLIHWLDIADVVFAIGIVGLVVVLRVAADAGADVRAVAFRHASALVAVRRIVDIVLGHLPVRRASDEGHQGNDWNES